MHDLVRVGEVMLCLSIPSPARFETARQLDVLLGGAEANVAAACARLGLRTAWVSALPAGPGGGGGGGRRGAGRRGGPAGPAGGGPPRPPPGRRGGSRSASSRRPARS